MDYIVFKYHLHGKEWIVDESEIQHDINASIDAWRVCLAFDKSIGTKSKMRLEGEKCIKYERISPDGQTKRVWHLIEE